MVDDDPLDGPEFDPVDYLNHHFPTERSLDRLEPFMTNVAVQIGDLDDEISKTVQTQSEAGHQATRDVGEAKAAIRELFEKIRDMKAKAEQSEVMVQEICRDIKQLDFAKRHLQTTITALKRLHMLVTAVDQLQGVSKAKQYRESANLLDAVRQLLTHFENYAQVRAHRLHAMSFSRSLSSPLYLDRDTYPSICTSSGLSSGPHAGMYQFLIRYEYLTVYQVPDTAVNAWY